MNLLKLTERAAHTRECCNHLAADAGSEEHQRTLAASLDALRKRPPTAPPVVVGLFNQCMAHGDAVIHAIARARTSPTPEARDRLQRSLARLRDSVDNLHGAATRPAGTIGRRTHASPPLAPATLRKS
jgi:hypothetical protein